MSKNTKHPLKDKVLHTYKVTFAEGGEIEEKERNEKKKHRGRETET